MPFFPGNLSHHTAVNASIEVNATSKTNVNNVGSRENKTELNRIHKIMY